jgi:hypothetical protein
MSIVEDMKPSGMRRAGSEVAVGNYNYDYHYNRSYDYNYNYNYNYNRNYNGNVNCINAEVAEGKARRRGVRRDASDPLSTSPNELFVGDCRSVSHQEPARAAVPTKAPSRLIERRRSRAIGLDWCSFVPFSCPSVFQPYSARAPSVSSATIQPSSAQRSNCVQRRHRISVTVIRDSSRPC